MKESSVFSIPSNYDGWEDEMRQLYESSNLRYKNEYLTTLNNNNQTFKEFWSRGYTPQDILAQDASYETRH